MMILCLIDLAVTFSGIFDYPAFLDILKVFIALVFVRTLREGWRRIFSVLFQSSALLMMIAAYVIFSSVTAYILYHGTVEDKKFLPNLQTTVFSMFVLMTTSNYPDIMIPYYRMNRSAFIFFGGFMAVGLYLLLNLLLAVFYQHYKNKLTKKTKKFVD